MMTTRHLFVLLILNCLSPTLSLAARLPDGGFTDWSVTGIAAHPTLRLSYIVDGNRWIRTIDGVSGIVQKPVADLGVAPWRVAGIIASTSYVYALTTTLVNNQTAYSLVTLNNVDLTIVSNVSLSATLSPTLQPGDSIYSTLLLDDNQVLYIVHRLANSSLLVHAVTQKGEQTNVWMAPFNTTNTNFLVTGGEYGLFYWQSMKTGSAPAPMYVTFITGEFDTTLYLSVPTVHYYDYTYGSLALTDDITLVVSFSSKGPYLFDNNGAWIQTFNYGWSKYGFGKLVLDSNYNSLGLDNADDSSITVISSTSGAQVAVWDSGVVDLFDVRLTAVDGRSNSILVSQPSINNDDAPLMRLEGNHGYLLQQYPAQERLRHCSSFALFVAPSGNIYNLLRCPVGSNWTTVLHGMTAAGQVRREVELRWSPSLLQPTLVVREDTGLFYLISNLRYNNQSAINRVMAFSVNGTTHSYFTDSRIGNIGNQVSRLLRYNDNTLALVDPLASRIALLDINSGGIFSNLTFGWANNTRLLSAVYDGTTWFCGEATGSTYPYSFSINQYTANGSRLAQYVLDSPDGVVNVALSVDIGGTKLYATKDSPNFGPLIVWWSTAARDNQPGAEEGVARILPSGVWG